MLEAAVEWDGPEPAEHADPEANEGFIDAARDTVKPWEIDILGHFSFQFYVHRFSGAATQAMTAFGMTPDYVREQRRAMSTFEIDIRFLGELHAGDLVAVKTGLVHLGNSSFRLPAQDVQRARRRTLRRHEPVRRASGHGDAPPNTVSRRAAPAGAGAAGARRAGVRRSPNKWKQMGSESIPRVN